MRKKIIIISGEPNSINSEIIFKTFKKLKKGIKKRIYLISNIDLLRKQFKILKYNIKLIQVKDIYDKGSKDDSIKVLNQNVNLKGHPFKISQKTSSEYVLKSLNFAHKIALNKDVAGIINCPINKNVFKKKIGVTEYLSSKCNVNDNSEVMLINNEKLSVSPITTHLDLREISKKLKAKNIIKKITTINNWFKKYKKKKPIIAILGLNPHNSELRQNSEEKKIIIPAIKKLIKKGIDVHGPYASDTIFINKYKKYDVIVGMYHDQVLAPYKALFNFNAINITLGLKYLRISPDHGIGLDLIKKNKASNKSLTKCINFLSKYK